MYPHLGVDRMKPISEQKYYECMPHGFQNITFSVNILQKIIINTGHNITKPKHYTFRNTISCVAVSEFRNKQRNVRITTQSHNEL